MLFVFMFGNYLLLSLLRAFHSGNACMEVHLVNAAVQVSPYPFLHVIGVTVLPVAGWVLPPAVLVMIEIGIKPPGAGIKNNPGNEPWLFDRIESFNEFPFVHRRST